MAAYTDNTGYKMNNDEYNIYEDIDRREYEEGDHQDTQQTDWADYYGHSEGDFL